MGAVVGGFCLCAMPYEKRCDVVMEKQGDSSDDWLTLAAQSLGNPPCLGAALFVKPRGGSCLAANHCKYFSEFSLKSVLCLTKTELHLSGF